MRHYLLVANQTLGSPELQAWVKEAIADSPDGCHLHVVVPATRIEHGLTWTEGEAVAAAQAALDKALADLAALGASVDGEVGDSNPVLAAADAMRVQAFDAIVVSTLPAGVSRWLKLDALSRIRRSAEVPVIHIESTATEVP